MDLCHENPSVCVRHFRAEIETFPFEGLEQFRIGYFVLYNETAHLSAKHFGINHHSFRFPVFVY